MSTRYVIQESNRFIRGWYDHPDLDEFRDVDKATAAYLNECADPKCYRYRLIRRDEEVLHAQRRRKAKP